MSDPGLRATLTWHWEGTKTPPPTVEPMRLTTLFGLPDHDALVMNSDEMLRSNLFAS